MQTLIGKYVQLIEDCKVYANGKVEMILNPNLVIEKGLTTPEIQKLKDLHLFRIHLFRLFNSYERPSRIQIEAFNIILETLEFSMQKVWGFEQTKEKHSWWFQAPHCNCPIHENWIAWGKEKDRIVSNDCLIHKKEVA